MPSNKQIVEWESDALPAALKAFHANTEPLTSGFTEQAGSARGGNPLLKKPRRKPVLERKLGEILEG